MKRNEMGYIIGRSIRRLAIPFVGSDFPSSFKQASNGLRQSSCVHFGSEGFEAHLIYQLP